MAADYRVQHREALDAATRHIERIVDADLHRPTPCSGWHLGQLLAHMIGQHAGFGRVVCDGHAPPEAFTPVAFTRTSWHSSVSEMLDAFSAANLDDRVVEVELDPERPLPITFLVAAQYLDTVVHTWDIAAALGQHHVPPHHVAETMWTMASRIPDDERRRQPGAAFAPGTKTHGSTWHRTLAALGRDPFWASPQPATPDHRTEPSR